MGPNNPPVTRESVLKGVGRQATEFDISAHHALYVTGDQTAHSSLILQRASLIRGLPQMLQEQNVIGPTLPPEEMDLLRELGERAGEMIDTNNTFGLEALLTLQGSRVGDPNILEKLIARIYPPTQDAQ